MESLEIPLFPLNTVLFPGGLLPLRIFEPRYLEMVSDCMKKDCGFGVVLIREGREAGGAATFHEVGTLARIIDFDRLSDGMLGITCRGERRLKVLAHRDREDRLNIGQVALLAEESGMLLPARYELMTRLLRTILEREEVQPYAQQLAPDWNSAAWVGNRLAELLPLPLAIRQALLQLDDPVQRLDELYAMLQDERLG